jgi:hypothetical protein
MTIAHATLTGAALHEPKGIATADSAVHGLQSVQAPSQELFLLL